MSGLRIEQAGYATLQDLGRTGHHLDGVPAGGAADQHAARVANILVGNPVERTLLEVTGSTLVLTARRDVLLAVTGATDRVLVERAPVPAWQPMLVHRGRTVTIEAPTRGHRTYVAVHGDLAPDEPRVLGSVAPDPLLEVGRRLEPGTELGLESSFRGLRHPHLEQAVWRFALSRPTPSRVIELTSGPDAEQFDGRLDEQTRAFEVSRDSDDVGLRLTGDVPERLHSEEILSRGVPVGAVEVTPDGVALVLLRRRLVTAGYPVLGVVTTVAQDRLGQLRPGDPVAFRTIEEHKAVRALREQRAQEQMLAARVTASFNALGVGA